MKLSKILRDMSRSSKIGPNSMLLHECADKAETLEQDIYKDVRDFHVKLGFPAPAAPDDLPDPSNMDLRARLIDEECNELCRAIEDRDLAAIAHEAVDVIYMVLGILVALGLPFLPFWRAVHKANMKKRWNPTGSKALKPKRWKKPNPRAILYHYKQGLKE